MDVLTFKLFFSWRWENPREFTPSRGGGGAAAARRGRRGRRGAGRRAAQRASCGLEDPVFHVTIVRSALTRRGAKEANVYVGPRRYGMMEGSEGGLRDAG